MQDRRRNERAKLWIFREIGNWRRWRHALRLTATAVITDSCHRFSKRWHVADVKNIAGDDQTTLMVHRNSANIACTFRFYVCLRLCNPDCCSAADGSGSCHAPAPLYFEEMTYCQRPKRHWRWPGNPNGRSKFIYVYTIASNALAAASRLMAASKDRSNSMLVTRIDRNSANTKIHASRSSKTSRKTSFCCNERRYDWQHCALFTFLLSLATAFVITFEK